MTRNNYDFSGDIRKQNEDSYMTNNCISRDIYDLQDCNNITNELITLGLEDSRTLADKWDIYVTMNATFDSDPDKLYIDFITDLKRKYLMKEGKPFYDGYDSDFDENNRVICSTKLPLVSPPAYNNITQPDDWKTVAMETRFPPVAPAYNNITHSDDWKTVATETRFPPVAPLDCEGDMMDMISDAMDAVEIGVATKIIKKGVTTRY